MELQTPNLITPYQGLTFLAGLAAERARQDALTKEMGLKLHQLDIQQQQHAEDVDFRKQQFDERIREYNAEGGLREAQRKEAEALSELHLQQATAYKEGRATAAQLKAAQIKENLGLAKALSQIPSSAIGTRPYQDQLDEIRSANTLSLQSVDGMRVFNEFQKRQIDAVKGKHQTFMNELSEIPPAYQNDFFTNPVSLQGPDKDGKMVFNFPTLKRDGTAGPPITREFVKTEYDRLKSDRKNLIDLYSRGNVGLVTEPLEREAHSSAWNQAKAALQHPDVDPIAVKQIYLRKGYNPAELDTDTPP